MNLLVPNGNSTALYNSLCSFSLVYFAEMRKQVRGEKRQQRFAEFTQIKKYESVIVRTGYRI